MRGGGHKDVEQTNYRYQVAVYGDRRSYIRRDGAEFLFGSDKKKRYRDVWERDGRRCVDCGLLLPFEAMHPHHRLERSKGGDDSLANLETLCSADHRQKHRHWR